MCEQGTHIDLAIFFGCPHTASAAQQAFRARWFFFTKDLVQWQVFNNSPTATTVTTTATTTVNGQATASVPTKSPEGAIVTCNVNQRESGASTKSSTVMRGAPTLSMKETSLSTPNELQVKQTIAAVITAKP